jgi:hypothetical protein
MARTLSTRRQRYFVTPRGKLIPAATTAQRNMPAVILEIKTQALTKLGENMLDVKRSQQVLNKMEQKYAPVFRKVEQGIYAFAKNQFRSEGAYGGAKWSRLTAATANQSVQSKSTQIQRGRSRYNQPKFAGKIEVTGYSAGGAYMPKRGYAHILRSTGALQKVVTGQARGNTAREGNVGASEGYSIQMDKINMRVLIAVGHGNGISMASLTMDLNPGKSSWKSLHQYGYVSSVWGNGHRPVPPRKFWPVGDIKNSGSQGNRVVQQAMSRRILNEITYNGGNIVTQEEKFLETGAVWRHA